MNRKTVVILGATCNLGIELSFIYAKNNFNLILISRNYEKTDNLRNSINQKFPDITITVYELDILDLNSQNIVYNKIKQVPAGIISLVGETHQVEKINEKKLLNIININFTYLINFLSFFLNDFEKKNEGFVICVSGKIPENLDKLVEGQFLVDGILYNEIKIKLSNSEEKNMMEVKLTEGKNREIRKVLNYFNLKVQKLKRISFGPFELNDIGIGNLVEIEIKFLDKLLNSIGFTDENNFRQI